MWQDYVLFVGQIGFLLALLPSIFSTAKPARSTSLLTALTMSVFTICFVTLHLRFTSIVAGLTSICWWVLFFQAAALSKQGESLARRAVYKHKCSVCGKEGARERILFQHKVFICDDCYNTVDR